MFADRADLQDFCRSLQNSADSKKGPTQKHNKNVFTPQRCQLNKNKKKSKLEKSLNYVNVSVYETIERSFTIGFYFVSICNPIRSTSSSIIECLLLWFQKVLPGTNSIGLASGT